MEFIKDSRLLPLVVWYQSIHRLRYQEMVFLPFFSLQIFVMISIVTSFSTIKLFANTRHYTTTTTLYGSLNKPPLELCDENINIVMDEIRKELGTLFGYDAGRLIFFVFFICNLFIYFIIATLLLLMQDQEA